VQFLGLQLSIRHVIFLAVMSAWAYLWLRRKVKLNFKQNRDLPFLALGLAVAIGTINGFIFNPTGTAFDDMNGYLTLAYILPLISVDWDNVKKRLLLQILGVSAVWVTFTTILYTYLFTHLPGKISSSLYTFVRDTRLAEITLQTSGPLTNVLGDNPWFFRIFQQSQIIVATFIIVCWVAFLVIAKLTKREQGMILGLSAVLIAAVGIGLSRSMALGLITAFVYILALVLISHRNLFKTLLQSVQLVIAGLSGLILIYLAISVPLPQRPQIGDALFYTNQADNLRETAVTSRWKLLGPMVSKIWTNPILGSGFGETVTYNSDDPRLKALNESGEVTTYRFEWGYHDLWLKMGLLGLLSFVWILVTFVTAAYETVLQKEETTWLVIGLTGGVIILYVTNIFSPYLNHPLGLMWLLFTAIYLNWDIDKLVNGQETAPLTKSPVNQPRIDLA
jgi:O-antigen ligase